MHDGAGTLRSSSASESEEKQPQSDPIATIVVALRERWRFTPQTIASLVANTDAACPILLLDSGMPASLRDELAEHVGSGRLTIIDVGAGTAANHARGAIASRLTSPYAVFIDNDAIAMPGWLDRLVDCAETTGAGITCPLYLWGNSTDTDLIHMAGGKLVMTPEEGGLRMEESHHHISRRLGEMEGELRREECDFGEFHCLMMRREVYSAPGMFDPEIVSVHEHIHASLLAREMGYATWLEPTARITYLAFSPWFASELPDFRRRWALDLSDRSLRGFARRWGMKDDPRYRAPIIDFLRKHHGRADLLDPRPRLAARRTQPFTRGDLQQSCAGLEWLAIHCGYDLSDIRTIARAYRIAIELTDGLYRPCGRPFINHAVGTASVLLFYGCSIEVVVGGLLHASFTHGRTPRTEANDRAIARRIEALGAAGEHAVKLALRHGEQSTSAGSLALGGDGADIPVEHAELWLLEAANDLDMHLSLEVAFTGRGDLLAGSALGDCRKVLELIALPGLSESLQAVRAETVHLPTVSFAGEHRGSFRFDQGLPAPAIRER